MPELAEVELARRIWARSEGEAVTAVAAHAPARIFRDLSASALQALVGLPLTGSKHHGKRMYFTFGEALHLEVHLGMSGKVYRCDQPDYEPQKHDHLILQLEHSTLILNDYRMFGRVMLHEGASPWQQLPPDPLSPDFTEELVHQFCERRPRKVLKGALLDQALFPGIGNWMADEICWRLKVHPSTPLGAVPAADLYHQVDLVCHGAIKYVADRNIDRQPDTPGFTAGGYVAQVPPEDWLFQHRWKKGGHCPSCSTALDRGTIATRTTAWCPLCQPPLPEHVALARFEQ